jgi:hypothetical protein
MDCREIEYNDVEPIVISTGRTGQTVTIRICRHSDGFFLDWSDDVFKAVGGVVTLDQALTEKDATNAPGIYTLASVSHPSGLDTSILTVLDPTTDDSLIVMPTAILPKRTVDNGEIKLKCLIDGCVNRKTVLSRVNAMVVGDVTLSPAPAPCPTVDAAYADEKGNLLFTTHNAGGARTTTP